MRGINLVLGSGVKENRFSVMGKYRKDDDDDDGWAAIVLVAYPAILSHLIVLSALCTFSTSKKHFLSSAPQFFFLPSKTKWMCWCVCKLCNFWLNIFPSALAFFFFFVLLLLLPYRNNFYSCLISETSHDGIGEGKMFRHEKWKIRSILCGNKFNSSCYKRDISSPRFYLGRSERERDERKVFHTRRKWKFIHLKIVTCIKICLRLNVLHHNWKRQIALGLRSLVALGKKNFPASHLKLPKPEM